MAVLIRLGVYLPLSPFALAVGQSSRSGGYAQHDDDDGDEAKVESLPGAFNQTRNTRCLAAVTTASGQPIIQMENAVRGALA